MSSTRTVRTINTTTIFAFNKLSTTRCISTTIRTFSHSIIHINRTSSLGCQGDGAIDNNKRNVVIQGSTVGDKVHIQAAKDVTIESAENKTTNNTQSNGKSTGIGAQLSAQGVGFYVEGNKSQGIENGTTVSHTQSVIIAKDTLKIESGQDTNILGSKVKGDRVEIKAGNDLNIASQQDSDNYNSKNKNSGILDFFRVIKKQMIHCIY